MEIARHTLAELVTEPLPEGTTCMITGSGFHAKDPCSHKCLSRWAVNSPDNTRTTPNVCTGKKDCTPGSCPKGQVCYSFDDPFDQHSYCIPDNTIRLLSWGALLATTCT